MGMSPPRSIQSPVGAEIVVDGRRYVNFAGSSYLGLSGNAEILEAGLAALRTCGAGYQLARHYGIATPAHQQAESVAAEFFGTQAALYLAAGYSFGLVAMAALRQAVDKIFIDEFTHHCLRESTAASGLPRYVFHHLDVEDLSSQLKQHLRAKERPLVVSDGMYSTFGEIAPLDAYAHALAPYEGRLLVDESHAFGVLGESGRGACEHHHVPPTLTLIGGSTSKGLGVVGGIIPATEGEVAALRCAPAARGASAGLPAAAAMCAQSLRHIRRHPELLQCLRGNVAHLKSRLRELGLEIPDSVAPVVAFVTGNYDSMRKLTDRLVDEGIYVLHSNYIGAGDAGVIRCGIFADHTREHLDLLVDVLRRLL